MKKKTQSVKAKFLREKGDKVHLNVRCTEEEKKLVDKNAALYTKGNTSNWVRFASIYLKPTKRHLENAISKTKTKGR